MEPENLYSSSGKTLPITPFEYERRSGSFAIIKKQTSTVLTSICSYSCRESFVYYVRLNTKEQRNQNYPVLFYHERGEGLRIARFIRLVEEKLGLETYTQVSSLEDRNKISLIVIDKWWLENFMCLHFFTILLRSARAYEGDFDKALYSNKYADLTRRAVEKFFQGFTKWAGTESDSDQATQGSPQEMNWKFGWFAFFAGGRNLELMVK